MITLERYERIREMLKKRASSVAEKYSIGLGGMNSYTDLTNLLGPSLYSLGQDFFEKNCSIYLNSLWAMRRYLRLIEEHSSFRKEESLPFIDKDFTCAFPDIMRKAEKMRLGSPLAYYVHKSAERLKQKKQSDSLST
ncbi:hypothetical protein HYW75_00150 [Candidatus Pacearchaeota archaeon]|nr:hypothetical protein [Candidatus Pacearchaeota archaeon]